MIPFVKMHGCGNDFVVVRAADLARLPKSCSDPSRFARRVCDRRFGVGADGLLAYGPSEPARDDHVRMRYWNSDGSPAEMCGNGARCVIRLAYERGETGATLELLTDTGTRAARVVLDGDRVAEVDINMGAAAWEPGRIPVRADEPVVARSLEVAGETLHVTALSMGNPHAVVFVADRSALATVALDVVGRALAEHQLFPEGANASFVCVEGDQLYARVWERGSGATLACGTASCAVTAAALRQAYVRGPEVVVHQPGGRMRVRAGEGDALWLAGPAAYVAEGRLSAELCEGREAREA